MKKRITKKPGKRARRLLELEIAAAHSEAARDQRGMNRSRGAASRGKRLDPDSDLFREIAARYAGK